MEYPVQYVTVYGCCDDIGGSTKLGHPDFQANNHDQARVRA